MPPPTKPKAKAKAEAIDPRFMMDERFERSKKLRKQKTRMDERFSSKLNTAQFATQTATVDSRGRPIAKQGLREFYAEHDVETPAGAAEPAKPRRKRKVAAKPAAADQAEDDADEADDPEGEVDGVLRARGNVLFVVCTPPPPVPTRACPNTATPCFCAFGLFFGTIVFAVPVQQRTWFKHPPPFA